MSLMRYERGKDQEETVNIISLVRVSIMSSLSVHFLVGSIILFVKS